MVGFAEFQPQTYMEITQMWFCLVHESNYGADTWDWNICSFGNKNYMGFEQQIWCLQKWDVGMDPNFVPLISFIPFFFISFFTHHVFNSNLWWDIMNNYKLEADHWNFL